MDNYLNSLYNSINIKNYKQIIITNEKLLNELTKRKILEYPLKGGAEIDTQVTGAEEQLRTAIIDLINKCGNNDETTKLLRSLLRYIDLLYGMVQDVDVATIRSQLIELQNMIESFNQV